jgi:hypothetical protein
LEILVANSAANDFFTVLLFLPFVLADMIALVFIGGARRGIRADTSGWTVRHIRGMRRRLLLAFALSVIALGGCGLLIVSFVLSLLAGPSTPITEAVSWLSALLAFTAGNSLAAINEQAAIQALDVRISPDGNWLWDGQAWQRSPNELARFNPGTVE